MALANAFFLLQLSLLLSTLTVHCHDHALPPTSPASAPQPPPHHHHHHHHHPPPPPSHPLSPPPSHTPSPPPSHPPSPPPSHPPTPTPLPSTPAPRKLIAIQGVVYCKSCKYRGLNTLMNATSLAGAVVKLQCNNTKKPLVEQTKTDKNGYFFFMPKTVTSSGSHKCKVFLVSSPTGKCSIPTNLHGGAVGAILIPSPSPPQNSPLIPFKLFTVGPFAFEPHKRLPCH